MNSQEFEDWKKKIDEIHSKPISAERKKLYNEEYDKLEGDIVYKFEIKVAKDGRALSNVYFKSYSIYQLILINSLLADAIKENNSVALHRIKNSEETEIGK